MFKAVIYFTRSKCSKLLFLSYVRNVQSGYLFHTFEMFKAVIYSTRSKCSKLLFISHVRNVQSCYLFHTFEMLKAVIYFIIKVNIQCIYDIF